MVIPARNADVRASPSPSAGVCRERVAPTRMPIGASVKH